MASPALIDALRQRRRLRLRRQRARKAPDFPLAAELEYISDLTRYTREIEALIERELFSVIDRAHVREDAHDASMIHARLNQLRVGIAERVQADAERLAARNVARINKANRRNLNEHWKRIIGIDPWANDDVLGDTLTRAFTQNVQLITSVPYQLLDQVRDELLAGYQSGARVETLKRLVAERFNVAESRAKLIARDQVGKINAKLSQVRQEAIGANSYTWQSSNDERVRPIHSALDGTKHRWNEPPITNENGGRNHPGEDIQCRCNAIADVDAVLERLGLTEEQPVRGTRASSPRRSATTPRSVAPPALPRSAAPLPAATINRQSVAERIQQLPTDNQHTPFTNPTAATPQALLSDALRSSVSTQLATRVTQAESEAIRRFTSGDYKQLREGTGSRDITDRQALKTAMTKAEELTEQATELYRGVTLSDANVNFLLSRQELKFADLTSWSSNPWVASDFSGKKTGNRVVFKVATRKGLPVKTFSKFEEEQETILPSLRYRVVSRESVRLPDGSHYLTLVRLEEIT